MKMNCNFIIQNKSNLIMRIVLVLSFLFIACSSQAGHLPDDITIDSIAVRKGERKMYVYENGRFIKCYRIALGENPKGRKVCKGDCRTPEGLYYIDDKNPESDYYKNLGISYPNERDKARAKRLGKSPGGDIKIHGLPNGKGYIGSEHRLYDWTEGCIAVTNREIDELFDHVAIGTPINILP